MDVLLVCSTGGHLLQLVSLRRAWEGTSNAWVTFDKSDARSLLAGERVLYAHGPTNRDVGNLLRNLRLAWTLLRRLRPRVIVTTGAGVAVPFCWIGRALGARVVYVESLSRITEALAQLPDDLAGRLAAVRAVARVRGVGARRPVRRQRLLAP